MSKKWAGEDVVTKISTSPDFYKSQFKGKSKEKEKRDEPFAKLQTGRRLKLTEIHI